ARRRAGHDSSRDRHGARGEIDRWRHQLGAGSRGRDPRLRLASRARRPATHTGRSPGVGAGGAEAGGRYATTRCAGRTGPDPARVLMIAAAISSTSAGVSSSVAAPIHPFTCSGVRAPTIAPVTPGQASVQATATADTVVA